MSDHQPRIDVDEHIDAAPAEVFEYVTDPERRAFGRDEQLQLGDELHREAPSRVAWEVTTADGTSRRAGTVEVAITPDGSGSRVRVIHRIGGPVATHHIAELALAA